MKALHIFLVVPLLAVGCRRSELVAGVTDSAFVQTMAELRRVQQDGALDSAGRASARAKALQGKGLSPAQLEAAARALARDPDRAVVLWREIETRANRDPAAPGRAPGDSVPLPPTGVPAQSRRRP